MALSDCNGEKVANVSSGMAKNSVMMKLKMDLQQKILDKRHSKGLGEIRVDFKPKSPQPVSRKYVH